MKLLQELVGLQEAAASQSKIIADKAKIKRLLAKGYFYDEELSDENVVGLCDESGEQSYVSREAWEEYKDAHHPKGSNAKEFNEAVRPKTAFDRWAQEKAKQNREAIAHAKSVADLDRRVNDYYKTAKDHAPKPKKLTPDQIVQRVDAIVGDSWPDGDPSDSIYPWATKNGLTMADIDKAINKIHKVKGGLSGYLASMWDDMARDALYDAKNGHVDQYSPYYDVDDAGKVTPSKNPWK